MTDIPAGEVRDKGPLLLLSQRFAAWLAAADVCLALTTYQAGRLFFIGRKDDGGIRAPERIIEQGQGLWTGGQTPWASARYMLWRCENVASGLSMPHSPRLYDGRLWLLNSGTGEFGTVDRASGAFTPVAFCPGYARGLAFAGRHAVIGLSRPRRNRTFEGLALDERLSAKDAVARCGL